MRLASAGIQNYRGIRGFIPRPLLSAVHQGVVEHVHGLPKSTNLRVSWLLIQASVDVLQRRLESRVGGSPVRGTLMVCSTPPLRHTITIALLAFTYSRTGKKPGIEGLMLAEY
jgi:hypothetical protein